MVSNASLSPGGHTKQGLSNIKRKEGTSSNSILKVRRKKYLNAFYRVAAVVVLVFSVTLGFLKVTEHTQEAVTYTEKISNKGETKSIFLADGTKVILNSDTKLTIPSDFNQEERIIEMEGEGFFDVTPNPDKPFIIKSGEAQVKVLGTSFDFKSYKEDDFIKLTVSTGKVRVNVVNQDMQLSRAVYKRR